ncbi:MAG: GNAT family N-acetyltransferase [Gammaproteobacteria bacterium]|nr:GNAT family N-acetyltransferase [Gammaproteobacteria bacterium]
MKFECYTNWDNLPESANTLFEQSAKDNIFYSRPWFENLSAVLNGDNAMALACVVNGDTVLAILPLIKSTGKSWYSLKHRYTPHFSLLLADENKQQVLACLSIGLSQLPISGLILEPVARDDTHLAGLAQAMEATGFECNYFFRHYNWIYRVHGQSYHDYISARPARLRNTISRKTRKLERDHGYEIHLYSGNEVPAAMPDYYAVYSASWKANEQYVSFLNNVVTRFSKKDWSRLAILYIEGQPAAAQLWFVHHGKASIFRLSYDEAWKQYSVGSILTAFLMEYVIDTDKVKEIDFLTGNDAYKQDWMSERRERYSLGCVKNAKPETWYERLFESLKRMLKPI